MNTEHPRTPSTGSDSDPEDSSGDRSQSVHSAHVPRGDQQTAGPNADQSLSSLISQGPALSGSAMLERIGRYRIIRLLGEGGFGCVYLAKDEVLHREVAVKVPRLSRNAKRMEKEFLTEARQLARLSHPGIVSVFDVGKDGDRCFIVSDYLRGPSLSKWMREHAADWRVSAMICMKIAEALAHAHAQRTIHRDLKPANIILKDGLQPVIVDFGLAVSDGPRADGTERGDISGTPTYMSPEQASGEGHRIDGRTDIYSLGAILYRMLTGRVPFQSKFVDKLLSQVINDAPQPPRQLVRDIPRALEKICLTALEKSLRDRYTTAADMAEDLQQVLAGELDAIPQIFHDMATDTTVIEHQDVGQTVIPVSQDINRSVTDHSRAESSQEQEPKFSSLAGVKEATVVSAPDQMIKPSDDRPSVTDSTSPSERPSASGSTAASRRTTSISRTQSQKRQVTIANCGCDVYENDDILKALDSEEQSMLLRNFQSYCAELATEFQGTVLQETDDGLLVCFGFPVALEDSARRAVRFALSVQDRLTQHRQKLSHGDVQLSTRVAVHTDSAIAEASVDEDDQTSSVSIVGAIRNVCGKLIDYAEPATVVVSHSTFQLCADVFKFASLGQQKVRGLPGAVELHEVISEHSRDAGLDGVQEQSLSPLIGRDREIGLLHERWDQAAEGMGQVVLLIGEAGLGKSRVVHTLKRHVLQQLADADSSPIAEWRASAQHQSSSFYSAVDFFERLLNFDRNDTAAVRLEKLVAYLTTLQLDGEEEIGLFAGLLSIPLAGRYAEPDLMPQVRKEKLLQLLLDWLRELSYRQPLLFIIEDLHWVDPSTLEFLQLLVDQGFNDHILTLFTFRPEFETPWSSKAHQTSLALNRLTRKQVQELMEQRAGRAFPEAVVDQIVERTDGVPLFVEEFTKLLGETGSCAAGDSSISTMETLRQIPASLQDMLMSRLDRIEADLDVIQLGAALGRTFSLAVLVEASALSQEQLALELQKLTDAELLLTQGRGSRLRYTFKHALIQDAAYSSLVKDKRRQLHQDIAQAIDGAFPEIADKQPEILAHHFAEAGNDEKALTYWRQAGERSLQRYAYREAVEQIRRALLSVSRLPDSRENKLQAIDLHISLGVPLQSLEGYSAPSVEENYAAAYKLCQDIQLPVQFIPVLYGLFRFYMLKARHDKARELGEQLVRLADEAGEDDYYLFAHRALAGPMIYQAEYAAAIPHLNKALSIPATDRLRQRGRRYDVVDPWVAAGSYKAWALWLTGFAAQAYQESQRAIVMAETLNHPFSLTLALSFASWLHQFSGDVDATMRTAERARGIAEDQGYQFWIGWHRVMISWARGIGKKDPSAINDISVGIEEWRAQGSELGSAYFSELRADVAITLGRQDEALEALDEADRLSQITGETFSLPENFRLRGKLAAQQKQTELAENHYRQAIRIAGRQDAKIFQLRSTVLLCRLLRRTDRLHEAVETLKSLRGEFVEGIETPDLKAADRLLNEIDGE